MEVEEEEEEDDDDEDEDNEEEASETPKLRKTKTVSATTAECLRVWKAHKAPVVAMALDPSGGLLATAGADRSARVFDTDAFFCTHAFHGHAGVVTAVAFHPHPKVLVLFTAGDDGTVRGWDLEGRSCLAVLRGHGSAVTALVPAPPLEVEAEEGEGEDERKKKNKNNKGSKKEGAAASASTSNPAALRLVSAGRDGVVVIWDWLSRSKSAEIAAMEAVEGAALVAFSSSSSSKSSSKPSPATAAAAAAAAAALAPGELTIATAGAKGAVRLWSSATRREIARLDAPGGSGGSSSSESSNGSGRELTALVAMAFASPSSSSLSPSRSSLFAASDRLLAATADGRVVALDGASSSRGGLRVAAHLIGDLDEITDVRFLGGSRAAKKAGGNGSGNESGGSVGGGWRPPTHAAVATASPDIRVMSLSSSSSGGGGCSASLVGHSAAVLALDSAFCAPNPSSAAAQWLLASGGKDASICVWRPLSNNSSTSSSSSPVIRPSASARAAHAGAVTALSWSRRRPGRFLVSGGDDRLLKVWDLEPLLPSLLVSSKGKDNEDDESEKKPARPFSASAATVAHDKAINGLDVSPDDALVATASQDRTAKIWRLPHLLPVATLRGHRRGVWDARFSPAARVVATASGDATVRLWSLPDGACLRSLEGHGASVLRCAFLAGGRGIASVGADGLLKTWSVRTGECASTSDAHDAKAWALDASDDGGSGGAGKSAPGVLATGGADGRLLLWRDASSAVASAATAATAADAAGAQALANALALGDVRGAAELALKLRAPARLLSAVQAAAALTPRRGGSGEKGGKENLEHPGRAALRAAVRAAHEGPARAESAAPFSSDGLRVALEAVRAWNARAATCHEAHFLLAAVLAEFSPAELVGGGGRSGGGKKKGSKTSSSSSTATNNSNADLFDAILAYTVRHARRADRLLEATYVVEAALAEAGVLSDDDDEDDESDGEEQKEGEEKEEGSESDGDGAAFDENLALPSSSSSAAARRAAAIARLNGEEAEKEEGESEEESEEEAAAAAAPVVVVEEEEEEEESESEEEKAAAATVATRRSARATAAAAKTEAPKKSKKRGSDAAPAASKKAKASAAAPAVGTPSRALRKR